jgi:hypothetical protein
VKYQTRRQRRNRVFLKRLGIWIFLILFAGSIAGGVALISLNPHR